MRLRTKEAPAWQVPNPVARIGDGVAQDATAGEERAVQPAADDTTLPAALRPDNPLSRQARALASSILASRKPDGTTPSMIAFIAIGAATEATVLIANIAIVLAHAGCRCLLVDANGQKAVQRRLFRLPPPPEIDAETGEREELLEAVTQTHLPQLSLLSLSPRLAREKARKADGHLYDRLRPLVERFDLILVDASQVDEVHSAMNGAEAVVLAVRRDRAGTQELVNSARDLARRDIHLIGSMVIQ